MRAGRADHHLRRRGRGARRGTRYEYGLVAYLFTRDLDRAVRVGEPLRTGMVGINPFGVVKASGFGRESSIPTPATRPDSFGGVKASGFGREGGNEGIEEYLEAKYLALTVRS